MINVPKPPTVIAWNTGCAYTKLGQRIAAKRIEGGIAFVDIDRGIWGIIKDKGEPLEFSRYRIMEEYINNRYTYDETVTREIVNELTEAAALVPASIKGF